MLLIDKLHFTTKSNLVFDLDIHENIVLVSGNSGAGKSIAFATLRELQFSDIVENISSPEILDKLCLIDIYTTGLFYVSEVLKKQRNKLIVIDNADVILNQNLATYIGGDISNQYIVFCRSDFEFGVSPNHYAKMVFEDNVFSLSYFTTEEGW